MRHGGKCSCYFQGKQADAMITVSPSFHEKAFGQVINPIVMLYLSFEKQLNLGSFFRLDQSQLNGPDILMGSDEDVPAQNWNFYNYTDFSDRLVEIEWSRSLEFPYQIQCGMMDFTLENTDGYFIPLNPLSTIGEYNLPSRPVKLYATYNKAPEVISQFVGLTQGLPDVQEGSKTVDYHAVDFLYDICNQSLSTFIAMRDVTTDKVIAKILEAYGLSPQQYQLATGRYKIPFVSFDIGEDAGTALKKLVQSEGGFMWLDEKGIVRFETSASINSDTDIVANLTDYDIISLEASGESDIINHVQITADIREVQEWQEVYSKSNSSTDRNFSSLWTVPAHGTLEVRCGLSDPCYDVVAPTLGKSSSVSWFTAQDSSLNEIKTGVTARGVLSTNAYTVTFTNTLGYSVEITEMKLWGEPAKVVNQLYYDAYDDESVEKYGDHLLEITDNAFFQTLYQADHYGRTIISNKKDYGRVITATIKGDFSFQLMDMIEITTSSQQYDGVYRIQSIHYTFSANSGLVTELSLIGASIQQGAFTLNISQLNSEDLIQ